jgi:2-dehydropantoate 2-reductase
MKITIIGTGAVGGYFGAKLVQAGFDVSFLARGKQLEAIRNHGIKIKSILGDFEVTDVKVTDNINDLGLSDLVILAVKAWQIKEVHHW